MIVALFENGGTLGMKRIQVFVLPVVLLLFVLLSTILLCEQVGVSQNVVPDNVIGLSGDKQGRERQREFNPTGIDPYHAEIDPFRQIMDKKMGDPRQWGEAPRHPIRESEGIMDMGIKDPANYALREKRPDRKSNAAYTSAGTWKIETVDAPNYFTYFYSRAIAVDASNHPHIAYGGSSLLCLP